MNSHKLCLLWQNQETRQWYHIANLFLTKDGEYSFSYERKKEKRGLAEALENGYRLMPSFPDVSKRYVSNKLFSTFSRRLPSKSRPDYQSILEKNGLNENSSNFEILTVTGGRLITDNYEFVKPVQLNQYSFSFDFYIRGWRHWNTDDKKLNNFKNIYFESDKDNEEDKDAVAVKDEEGIIGYVPAFYSDFMTKVLENNIDFSIVDGEFNEKALSHNKVKLTVAGQVTEQLINDENLNLLVTI